MFQLVKTMNDASGASKVEDDRLNKWFTMSWEDFERQVGQSLAAKPTGSPPAKPGPTERELLEEVLSTVRRLAIEPRMRMEELMLGGPFVAPPEIILREISRLPPRLQQQLFDLLRGVGSDPESVHETMHLLRRQLHRIEARTAEEAKQPPQTEDPKKLSR